MRRKKNREGPEASPGTPPRGPDGKAGGILPREETMIRAELVGGPLDGTILDLEDSSPRIHVPAEIVRERIYEGPVAVFEIDSRKVGVDRRDEWNEYALDRVSSEGTAAFFRFVGRSR